MKKSLVVEISEKVSPELIENYSQNWHSIKKLCKRIDDYKKDITSLMVLIFSYTFIVTIIFNNWIKDSTHPIVLNIILLIIILGTSCIIVFKLIEITRKYDAAKSIIHQFQKDLNAVDPQKSRELKTLDEQRITLNLIEMAKQKRYAEGILEFIQHDKTVDQQVLKEAKQNLENTESIITKALLCAQRRFLLQVSRREIFSTAEEELSKTKVTED